MTKISLVGFGGIGIEAAKIIIQDPSLCCNLVCYDRKEAIDADPSPIAGAYEEMRDAIGIQESGHCIHLTSNLDDVADSDVIIVTAGLPRKQGQSRADLINDNAATIGPIAEKIGKIAPNVFLIMVTNPLDAMVELAYRKSGLPVHMVVGQAGVLDTGRLTMEAAHAAKSYASQTQSVVLGGHGPQMVPIYSHTYISGKPISDYVDQKELDAIEARVADRGATIIKKQGRSATFSTAMAAVKMVRSYILDQRKALPAAARLNGEYGVKDLFVGVITEISRKGVKVLEIPLSNEEKNKFNKSVEETRKIVAELK
ncbi:MAG: malate dehydrogenase [Spirochaetia bacterium]|nr:malate dehydrogenase [Spirochaetia bacterium]